MVTTYGLWDQIRVDKGKEWYLSLFINKTLSSYRHCTSKPPYLQTTSKKVTHTVCLFGHRLYRLRNRDWKRPFNLLAVSVSPARAHLQSFLAQTPPALTPMPLSCCLELLPSCELRPAEKSGELNPRLSSFLTRC